MYFYRAFGITFLTSLVFAQSSVNAEESQITSEVLVSETNSAEVTLATESPSPPFANSTGSGQQIWVVRVGSPDGKFVFSPNVIKANPGDLVQFQFYARNHSVASGNFETPCLPNNIGQGEIKAASNAFFSGFMPTSDDGSLTYTIAVADASPVWFYCSAMRHCQEGMVGVINQPADGNQTIENFALAAKEAPENVSPVASNGNIGGDTNLNATETGSLTQSTKAAGGDTLTTSWQLLAIAGMVCLVL